LRDLRRENRSDGEATDADRPCKRVLDLHSPIIP
jgi:hypothetical protein